MGCIVNGPGEMADADFGYVGGAPGKIDLYVGKEVVQRGIPMEGVSGCLLSLRAFGEPSALVQWVPAVNLLAPYAAGYMRAGC
jgi:hypothetical protein